MHALVLAFQNDEGGGRQTRPYCCSALHVGENIPVVSCTDALSVGMKLGQRTGAPLRFCVVGDGRSVCDYAKVVCMVGWCFEEKRWASRSIEKCRVAL